MTSYFGGNGSGALGFDPLALWAVKCEPRGELMNLVVLIDVLDDQKKYCTTAYFTVRKMTARKAR